MPSYLFELGNSADGPIGLSVRARAAGKAEALQRVRDFVGRILDDTGGIDLPVVDEDEGIIEYGRIYLSADNITVADISDGDTEEDVEEEGGTTSS